MDTINRDQVNYTEVIVSDGKKAAFIIESELNITNFKLMDDKTIRIYDSTLSQKSLSRALIEHNVEIEEISKKTSSLEDYFLKLINGGVVHA